MTETPVRRAMREAVATVSSRRLKDSPRPAGDFRPRPRSSGPPRLVPAREPHLGAIGRAAVRLRSGELSCKELLEESLEALEREEGRLKAFAEVTAQSARLQAAAMDEELAGGRRRGPLHGIPISVADGIEVEPARLTAPTGDAPPVVRLRDAGAVLLGRTTTDELSLGVATPQSRNPRDPGRVPGGSSGGSAIAVAAGMGLGSVGSDTRGGVRIPAALCGAVGFRPTFGTVPAGLLGVSWSMDCVGPLSGSVPDAAVLLDVLASSKLYAYAGSEAGALRVGVPLDGTSQADYGVLGAFSSSLQVLGRLAGSVVDVTRPSTLDFSSANAAGLVISVCEAAAHHRRLGLDRARFLPETREQLEGAEGILAADYLDAQRLRRVLADAMLRVFEEVDVLVMPTTLVPAPAPEEAAEDLLALSRNTVLWSLVGCPAVSVPCGTTAGGLPVGLQMVAPPHEEASLVALACAFEAGR